MRTLIALWAAGLFLAACRGGTPVPPTATYPAGNSSPPTLTPPLPGPPRATLVPPTPTATPIPLALRVNGGAVTRADFQAEVDRLQASGFTGTPEEAAAQVREGLIDEILLAQGAAAAGFTMDEATLEIRLAQLTTEAGGPEALAAWQATHFYTPERFREDLRRDAAAAWMRDNLAAAVPETAEQVRSRHIRVSSRAEAENVLARLASGVTFDVLLTIYDPEGLGEMGWFPRGYLFEPALEEAAFALQPGETSGIIETSLGFHLVQVIDRAEARPLAWDVRLAFQARALAAWLDAQRNAAAIEVLQE